jgi:rare lipoprotein A (peptidoglycan hydrolase)
MEAAQVQQLKLNATNIKSVLIRSNTELRKIKLQKKDLINAEIDKEKKREKEKKLESGIKSSLNNVKNAVFTGPMNIFDKIMEFAGIILLGILVNNLPTIISKLQEFFTQNSAFINGVIEVIKFIGSGIVSLSGLVSNLSSGKQNQIAGDRKKIDQDLGGLKQQLSDASSKTNDIRDAINSKKKPSGGASGGGQQPVKRAKGGSIPSRPQTTKSTSPAFTAGETGRAKRARQTTNYFGTFNQAVKDSSENSISDQDNIKLFEKMSNNFKKVLEKMGVSDSPYGKRSSPGSPGSSGSTPGAPAVPVKSDEVVGYSGGVPGLLSSGNSRGEHIHMENGDGYTRPGGIIPSDVLQNVLVNGSPISSYGTSRDPNTGHEGYDFQTPAGLPVNLTGGLKFVEYDAATSSDGNAGFGDSLIIMDSKGKKYLLGHMSGGPKDPQAIKDKQNKAIQNTSNLQVKQKITGKQASWYGPGFFGRTTASGEEFTGQDLTAAMNNVAFGTRVRVTNGNNGKSVVVRVNDRGPFESDGKTPNRTRIIDLSQKAADEIGLRQSGLAPVTVEILESKPKTGIDPNAQSLALPNLLSPAGSEGSSNQVVIALYQPIEKYVPIPYAYPTA